jgi:Stage II sporulation protein E (SpoIIE)/Domain of unknown function (DUF4118)
MSGYPNRVRALRRLWLVRVDGYRRYGLAVGAVALALLLALSLQHLWQQPPTLLFTAAIILTSLYGGLRAGFLASVLSWFATVFLCQFDPQTHTLIYAGAGHESYLLDASGEVTPLRATGLPLGIRKGEDIESSPAIALHTGQIVLLLSDGILESQAADGRQFGLGRALEVVQAKRHESARDVVAALCQAAQDHSRQAPQNDDMTVVVVKVQSSAEQNAGRGVSKS